MLQRTWRFEEKFFYNKKRDQTNRSNDEKHLDPCKSNVDGTEVYKCKAIGFIESE